MKQDKINEIKHISIFIVAVIIIIIGVFSAYDDIKLAKDRKVDRNMLISKQLTQVYEERLEDITQDLLQRAKIIANQEDIQAAIKNGDRQALKQISYPKYQALKDSYSAFQKMHYHLKDHTSFLRVHLPSVYGDDLKGKRPIIDYVIQTKKSAYGFDCR